MLRATSVLLTLLSFFSAQVNAKPENRPKLVIGIVVDQMRPDYLDRFGDRMGQGGFKRMLNEGFECSQTYINYLPSFTAPGHACIYTGSVPALHGIAANDWIERKTGQARYCVEDKTVKGVGGGKAGEMSPRNLLASTIADELRLATNFKSRSFGISIKDRGSIIPAGHSANAAYWYDGENGHFISSTYYMNELPRWMQDFNAREVGDSLMGTDWNTLYKLESYLQSTADDNAYEGVVKGEKTPTFPHKTSVHVGRSDAAIRTTPFGNTLVRLAAEACIRAEQLGQKGATDFLAISFSSTDYVGHQYGPNSIEIEDTYLRLDKDLELLFGVLDKTIGANEYVVFLTADHGGAHNTTFLNDHKIPGSTINEHTASKDLSRFLSKEFGDSDLVQSMENYQVYFNEARIREKKIDRELLRNRVMSYLENAPGVSLVMDMEHPDARSVPVRLKEMAINGYNYKRGGGIQIILDPAWYSSGHATGTTHGSWNPYDTRIPLLWYGRGISKGKMERTVHMTDISPTLAALLHIQVPNASIGEVIEEVLAR